MSICGQTGTVAFELKREVRWLLMCQWTFCAIAEKLNISKATVEAVVTEIIDTKNVTN